MKKTCTLFLAILLTVAGGCGKMPLKHDYKILEAAPSILPKADSAVVCFLREKAFIGGGVSYFVYEGQQIIGLLRSGSYFQIETTPGEHTYWAETESKSFVSVHAEAGKTAYVVGGIAYGALIYRPTLQQADAGSTKHLLPDLKYTVLATEEEAAASRKAELEKKEGRFY